MGARTTSAAVLEAGRLVHVDAVAVGGHHVTMDVARGLQIRVAEAERLKTLHGSTIATASCERDFVTVAGAEDGAGAQVPRSQLVRIIRPRVEEILELVRDRLRAAGFPAERLHRVVLTGGASQLPGLPDVARAILGSPTRAGRPVGIAGLPEAARGPAFAAAAGLIVAPQLAHLDRSDAVRGSGRSSG